MTLRADVLVVGGGMAGAMAALAARAAQARVVLVRRAPAATALSSGAIGIAPDLWAAPEEPFAARLGTAAAARRLAATRPDHPYAVVGASLERLEEAMRFAAGELAPVLAPPGDRPLFLATPYGAVSVCAVAQRTMLAGDLATARGPIAVVGFRGHLGFDARLVAGGLARHAAAGAPEAIAVEVDLFMREEQSLARPHELARALDAPHGAEHAGEVLRRALPAGAGVALLPPVLGLDPASLAAERLSRAAGLPVAETLSDVPSVPGWRLQAAIDARLAASGVEVISAEVEGDGPGCPARAGELEIEAPRWVLATGRFVGGGIVRRGRLVEPLLGLPVTASEGGASGIHLAPRPSATLTARERRAPQPLLAAGVRVDRALRPLGADGRPVHPGLFAAGAVVGGHEAAADGTGMGVAILTGFLAGRAAAEAP
ncbi:MAG TPA: FAD-dependent oxidoreductase [Anaeromyxobacteraceae bacterium]|nr:FAD-dependent oxidoreductase [Anaeromyxobacteraceae bacterium]